VVRPRDGVRGRQQEAAARRKSVPSAFAPICLVGLGWAAVLMASGRERDWRGVWNAARRPFRSGLSAALVHFQTEGEMAPTPSSRSDLRPLPATGGISFRRGAPRSRLAASCQKPPEAAQMITICSECGSASALFLYRYRNPAGSHQNPQPVVRSSASDTLPGPAPGACFAGPHFPWSLPFAPTPQRLALAPPCS
jgi:hypothetical protein